MAIEITAELVNDFFDYNQQTGLFTSKGRDKKYFKTLAACEAFNSRYKGKEVGLSKSHGYKKVAIFGKEYSLHRLAHLIMLGEWPKEEVDHINGNRSDNRWVNLRPVTRKENTRNKCIRSNNTSGICGVYFDKQLNKWRSKISTNKNKNKHLGVFSNLFDAVCARKSAENKYGYHINHGRLSSL